MIQKENIQEIVTAFLADTDYYLVDVSVSNDNRIEVQIDALAGVSVDFCAELNRHIEAALDRDVEDYELEVGSAGLTEPFKVPRQYEKNIGNEVETLTCDGRKLRGLLTQVLPDGFEIEQEIMVKPEGAKRKVRTTQHLTFKFDEVKYTKYFFRFK